jgi:hypothetical protein
MKSLLLILLSIGLVFVCAIFSPSAFADSATPSCYSGAWYEPATSGSGFFVEISADSKAIAWFTFNNGAPVWFTAQGAPTDAQLDLYETTGTAATLPATGRNKIGRLSFTPVDTNTATLEFTIDWPTAYCSGFGPGEPLCGGRRALVRLVTPAGC